MSMTYIMNRAVDKPIECRGLKAQYILYAGGVLVGDIFLFAILYICRVDSWACLFISFALGGGGVTMIYKYCKKYGQYGWAKKRAAERLPFSVRCSGLSIFSQLNKQVCNNH